MTGTVRRLDPLVRADEPLLWLGLYALFLHADASGSVPLARAALEFRDAILARRREGRHDADGRSRGVERMEAAEVSRYLSENLVGRLQAAGLASVEPGKEPRVRFSQEVWSEAAVEREALLAELRTRGGADDRPGGPAHPTAPALPLAPHGRPPAPAGASVLRTAGLVKSFGGRRVVDAVDLAVRQGEIVGLLGPNGAGKTTTFYMIVGLIKADEGRVFLDERELTGVPMYRRARAGIGYLSQEPSIFRRLTVEQNVMAILETLDLTREERKRRLEELLEELSIKHLRRSMAYSLSGGERRRLEITRALVTRPKFMLLDEPFAGVDPIAVDDIQRIVAELRARGLGVLITDHNVRETLSITDRAYLMFNGRIHIEGPAEALVNDPEARKMYLGLDFRL